MQTRRKATRYGQWLLCTGLAGASLGSLAAGERDGATLDHALQGFARQSGLQLIYVADTTRGLTTDVAPSAGVSPSEGLQQLLAGTGLVYEFLNDRTVEIRAPGRSPLTVLQRTALQRTGHPDDIAEAVRWLIMDAHYTTGQILRVDGGRALNI